MSRPAGPGPRGGTRKSAILAEARRIRVFPDVPNLPLRGPAMISGALMTAVIAVGRSPGAIRGLYNVVGQITEGRGRTLLQGPPAHWIETLTAFAVDLGLDTFILWPSEDPPRQLERFAGEVIPGVRAAVEKMRQERGVRPQPKP